MRAWLIGQWPRLQTFTGIVAVAFGGAGILAWRLDASMSREWPLALFALGTMCAMLGADSDVDDRDD